MKTKMMNSKFGKILRRLVGEEAGAVMMEYVILAVLIAAAAVVAIAYFGRTVTSEANVASIAMTGLGNEAAAKQEDTRTKLVQPGTAEAATTADSFSDAKDGETTKK